MIRDGDDDDDQPGAAQMMEAEDDGMDRRQFADDGKSKLVQEAKAMMRDGDDDEDKPAVDENAGPKIKMGRIGKKKKTRGGPAANKQEDTMGNMAKDRVSAAIEDDTRGGNEGFTPEDIEFMRQAI